MKKRTLTAAAIFMLVQSGFAEQDVTNIQAVHRNGQTFVTWKDVAEGKAGADYRYSFYCSEHPITETNLADLKPVIHGIVNNSGKHYGYHMFQQRPLDLSLPMATIESGGKALPPWSGLAVCTVENDGAMPKADASAKSRRLRSRLRKKSRPSNR